jgi:2-methylcitrate dehydratase PrpD
MALEVIEQHVDPNDLATWMTFAHTLAERIQQTRPEQFPSEAVRWAKAAIRDTIAVTIAGVDSPTATIARRVTGIEGGAGACQVLGTPLRCGALAAARANGTAAHALDYDDIQQSMMGHPSVAVLPAVLALAEAQGRTGRDALLAYLTGLEVSCRLGRVVGFSHFAQGWHATETLGIFGAAAAASRLLGLSPDQTATALAISVSLAAGVRANFGTMMKPLHAGLAASNGVLAARLARDGFTADHGAFEHPQGFFALFRRSCEAPDVHALDGWLDPPEILVPGIALKLYPCGAHTHPFIEMIRRLAAAHGLTADTVARIDILAEQSRHAHTNRPEPKSGLDAKFSVHYTVARALRDGCVLLSHFDDAAVREPAVRAVMAKIHPAPHPDMDASWADKYGGEMTVTTTNGRQFSDRIVHQLARGPEHPVTDEELWTKFQDCTATVLSQGRTEALFAALGRLEGLESIADVVALTAPDR